jgi:putative flippase GtrA
LSVRFVFAASVAGGPTHGQRVSFVMSALLGLAITVGLVSLLTTASLAPAFAKAASVGVSFVAVYLARKYVVFGAR